MQIDYKDIVPYVKIGLISEQAHPEDSAVRIFNYTQKCQFEKKWDNVTKMCRGLILNIVTGEVIARPFEKFFNYQEYLANNWPIPTETPIITEKLDGSLGILYVLNGKPWIATRGSFTSEQALWATEWYRKNVEDGQFIEPMITNLFEIIYPKNRIVVNYDYSGLVHLTSIFNETGRDVDVFWSEPIRTPKTYKTTDLEALAKMDEPNGEGFVVFFPKANLRMKIKFPEYVRLHKLVTGLSEISIWEFLKEGKPLGELLEKVPNEFFEWVSGVQHKLFKAFVSIENRCLNDFARINHAGLSRKQIAIGFQECKYPSVLFSMLDGKDYEQNIWRMLRPRGQHIFKNDIDL